MASAFESAARVAIEEMILERAEMSKFGYFLTKEALAQITDDLFHFLQTSRSLKAAGDKMLVSGPPPAKGRNQLTTAVSGKFK